MTNSSPMVVRHLKLSAKFSSCKILFSRTFILLSTLCLNKFYGIVNSPHCASFLFPCWRLQLNICITSWVECTLWKRKFLFLSFISAQWVLLFVSTFSLQSFQCWTATKHYFWNSNTYWTIILLIFIYCRQKKSDSF